jgi:ABC-type sugar transport system ATPase subunit
VTGVPVRERNVAMVYQQFINYPSMTVADNIASPLKLRGDGPRPHPQRVHDWPPGCTSSPS